MDRLVSVSEKRWIRIEVMTMNKEILIQEFKNILADENKTENHVQSFLETHTELIPLPFLLNHHLHFNAIVSKFPISTSLTTDFLYITKSTDFWNVVCIELESQHKRIFTNSRPSIHFHAEFNHAYDQVLSWKSYVQDHQREVVELLKTLFHPIQMARNPIEFKYVLIMGRNFEKRTEEHTRMFHQKNTHDIRVMTYDSLLSRLELTESPSKRIILSKSGDGFKVKNLDTTSTNIFSYLGPHHLELTPIQIDRLQQVGFDMDAWLNGELLNINSKIPGSKTMQHIRQTMSKRGKMKVRK